MKIALVYDCIYPYSKGGVERRLFDISGRLQESHEVHLFGMKYWHGRSVIKESGIHYHGVCKAGRLYTSGGKRSIRLALWFSLCLFPALMRGSFDVVDCQNIPYFPAFACKLYCLLRKKPLIITWYEVWEDYWYEYLGWKGWFGKLIEKSAAALTEHNLAISSKTCADYRKISSRPITIMPLGIELSRIQSAEPSGQQFDVLYAGRLIREKGVDSLIRCISMTGIRCGIIGDGPERQALEDLSRGLKLDGQVAFLGFVDNVYSYMKSSKAFVFPSRREGFGLVVVEANACGLPVVVMKHPNNASVDLIDGKGFVCEDEDEMSMRIAQLLNDDDLREEMGRRALASAAKYDWDVLIHQYEEFCMRVCGTRRLPD